MDLAELLVSTGVRATLDHTIEFLLGVTAVGYEALHALVARRTGSEPTGSQVASHCAFICKSIKKEADFARVKKLTRAEAQSLVLRYLGLVQPAVRIIDSLQTLRPLETPDEKGLIPSAVVGRVFDQLEARRRQAAANRAADAGGAASAAERAPASPAQRRSPPAGEDGDAPRDDGAAAQAEQHSEGGDGASGGSESDDEGPSPRSNVPRVSATECD